MSEETQFDEVFDTQLDVKANPSGAWRAIQSQHAEITRLRAEVERLRAENGRLTDALNIIDALDPEDHHINGCSADALRGLVLRMGRTARAALGDDTGEGDA